MKSCKQITGQALYCSNGFQLEYRVQGHSQNGRNWKINEICNVYDEIFNISGNFLIYKRTFELNKDGAYTVLKLSYPGVVQ